MLNKEKAHKEKNLQQLIKLLEKNPDLKNSFIQDIFEIMLSGDFTDVNIPVDLSCQDIIGEMNDLEKALFTLRSCYERTIDDLQKRFHCQGTELQEKQQIKSKIFQADRLKKIFGNGLWTNIVRRLSLFFDSGFNALTLHSDYQITVMQGSSSPDEDLFNAILIFSESGREC